MNDKPNCCEKCHCTERCALKGSQNCCHDGSCPCHAPSPQEEIVKHRMNAIIDNQKLTNHGLVFNPTPPEEKLVTVSPEDFKYLQLKINITTPDEKCGCHYAGEEKCHHEDCKICRSNSAPSQPVGEWEVALAEEGTPLADFQKARTEALSMMFDRDPMCGVLHSTSKLYAALDAAFSRVAASEYERGKGEGGWEGYHTVFNIGYAAALKEAVEAVPEELPGSVREVADAIADGHNGCRSMILARLAALSPKDITSKKE